MFQFLEMQLPLKKFLQLFLSAIPSIFKGQDPCLEPALIHYSQDITGPEKHYLCYPKPTIRQDRI